MASRPASHERWWDASVPNPAARPEARSFSPQCLAHRRGLSRAVQASGSEGAPQTPDNDPIPHLPFPDPVKNTKALGSSPFVGKS